MCGLAYRKVNERTSRITCRLQFLLLNMHVVVPLIDESSGESPLTVEYPGNGVARFNAAIRVAIKRYNHAVTWATRHFISLISISKKYESNFKEISKLHLLVVIYECTSGQRKHSTYSSCSPGSPHRCFAAGMAACPERSPIQYYRNL